MTALFYILITIIDIYWWLILATVVLSWLYAFNVVNPANQAVRMVGGFIYEVTEPVLSRIRRIMPNLGTIDISPIVVLIALTALRYLLKYDIAPIFGVFLKI